MKFNEVVTTLKNLEPINGNVKNASKSDEKFYIIIKYKGTYLMR